MPHISVKMLKGRTDEQKELVAKNLSEALAETLGCGKDHISVAIEDYTPLEWQGIFRNEITDKKSALYKEPNYDPKDLL